MFDYDRDRKYVLEVLENFQNLDYRLRSEINIYLWDIQGSLYQKKEYRKAKEPLLERVIDLIQILASVSGYDIFIAMEYIDDYINHKISTNRYLHILNESKKCRCEGCALQAEVITSAPLPLNRVIVVDRKSKSIYHLF